MGGGGGCMQSYFLVQLNLDYVVWSFGSDQVVVELLFYYLKHPL